MNEREFISPRYDVAFKSIFGQEGDKRPLMSLLSSIMDLSIETIEDLILLDTELSPEFKERKHSRLEIRIKLKDKTEIEVEVQVIDQITHKERELYYWSKLYENSFVKGLLYGKLKKCVVINIVYYELFETTQMHTKFQILETHSNKKFTDNLEIHFLELSKLNAYNRTITNSLLIDWAEFLSLSSEDDLMEFKDRTDLPEDVLKAVVEFERIKDDPDLHMEALLK